MTDGNRFASHFAAKCRARRVVLGRDVSIFPKDREELKMDSQTDLSFEERELIKEFRGWMWARGINFCAIINDLEEPSTRAMFLIENCKQLVVELEEEATKDTATE